MTERLPIQPLSTRQRLRRTAETVVCSIALGSIFGIAAALGMGVPGVILLAAAYGAVTGLVTSPALVFGVWHGPWFSGLAWIAVPTTLAAFLAGVFSPPGSGPLMSMQVSIATYVLAAVVRGVVGRHLYRPVRAGTCAHCGYDITGPAAGAPCPECGALTSAQTPADQR